MSEMTELVAGIHQLKIPIPNNPLGYTNSYLMRGDSGYTIIDPGMNSDVSFNTLQKELSEIGIDIKDITRIIATHAHGDHYGLSGRIKKLTKAEILAHQLTRDMIQTIAKHRRDWGQQMDEWLRLNGAPPFDDSEFHLKGRRRRHRFTPPPLPDVILEDGKTITVDSFSFQVLWTPGHDSGHICLYEPDQKVLFSGDHVLPVTTPHVNMQTPSVVNPLGDFLNSLKAIKYLEADLVLPGHEETFTNLKDRIEELLQHHQQRNEEIIEVLKVEEKTAYQVSTKIIWMPVQGGVRFTDLSSWHKMMAISETLAHLKAMEIEGKVAQSFRDGIVYYQYTC